MKCAVYARVSTKDAGQDTENQLIQLRRYAASQQWDVVEFVDHESGKSANRAQMQAVFAAAARREIGVVLVWALDRFTREGVAETFAHIKRLLDHGVQFESYTEPHFRTTGPAGELMIAVAAWIAKHERLRISERTKAGLERARREGKQLGRRVRVFDRNRAIAMRKAGHSWREISRVMAVPVSTLRDALESVRKTSPRAPQSAQRKQKT